MVKKFLLISCITFVLFIFPAQKTFAHLSGQPPFFLINGKYSGYYPIYVSSLKNFLLPQDSAPENYFINQPLTFEIDQQMLPFPSDVLEKITYTWDFGDGTRATGSQTVHNYKKMGSYLLTIHADYGGYSDANTKSLLEAVMLNVLPNSSYKLPQAVITVNGKTISDPSTQPVDITSEQVTLDASNSKPGSAPITSFFWDRGNGTSSSDKQFTYRYTNQDQLYTFPFLRVKDRNGFISDSYVQINRDIPSPKVTSRTTQSHIGLIAGIVAINAIIIAIILFFLRRH